VCLDVETHDKVQPEESRIVDIGLQVFYPDKPPYEWETLVNPEVEISKGAIEVHGITNEMVREPNVPTFAQLAHSLYKGMIECDFAGYNLASFDLRVFQAEFKRAGIEWDFSLAFIVDGYALDRHADPRTLGNNVKKYLGRESINAHRAFGDTIDAAELTTAIIDKYGLPRTPKELHELTFASDGRIDLDGKFRFNDDGVPIVAFGQKHNGKTMQQVYRQDPGYFSWMYGAKFAPDTRRIARDAMNGVFPQRRVKDAGSESSS
jgi:DNA polymerase III subunit epsilon